MTRSDTGRKSGKGDARQARGVSAPETGSFATVFRQHQATAVDSLLRLLHEPVASLLTWAVIGIALALPLCLTLLLQNLAHVGSGVAQGDGISLFMERILAPEQLQQIADELAARSDVAAVELITADAALQEFQQSSGLGDVLEGLEENPLPAVIVVTPAPATELAALRAEFAAMAGVEFAQLDLEWIQRLNALVALATRGAGLLGLMLGLGVVLVIGNTVRLAIENRRAEIVVVKLVGGTDAYVARPFLYTGLWYGVGGGLLAVLGVFIALLALQQPVSALLQSYGSEFRLEGLGLGNSFFVLLGAGALGWLGAWVSVQRHLRAIEPR